MVKRVLTPWLCDDSLADNEQHRSLAWPTAKAKSLLLSCGSESGRKIEVILSRAEGTAAGEDGEFLSPESSGCATATLDFTEGRRHLCSGHTVRKGSCWWPCRVGQCCLCVLCS